jgi:hypothetical protein
MIPMQQPKTKAMNLGGVIIKKIIKFVRAALAILSCLLLIFIIYAWLVELRISDSEWLAIMVPSSLNLLLLLVYWVVGISCIKPSNIQENKVVRVLSKVGFGGNIVLFICCILIVIGFGIIP